MTDDGPLDRAAALERATAATALPTGVALAVAAVVASDHPARSLVVSAAVAITVATALHVAEGAIARPGRLRGLDGQPIASPRATMLRALPGVAGASLALALLFVLAWLDRGAPSAALAGLPLGAGLDALVALLVLRRWERRHRAVVLVGRGRAWPWTRRGVTLASAAQHA